MPSLVRGYHGTTLPDAQNIVRHRQISGRVAPYHWLGQGVYFWEDAPLRAWEWAQRRSQQDGAPPAVVSAYVALRDCLDFLDISYWSYVRQGKLLLDNECRLNGRRMPRQQPPYYREFYDFHTRRRMGTRVSDHTIVQNFNYLDCDVIECAVLLAETRTGKTVRSVRAAFLEGQQLYENSYFFDRNHVQIAVRDPSMISDLIIEPDTELRRRFGTLSTP